MVFRCFLLSDAPVFLSGAARIRFRFSSRLSWCLSSSRAISGTIADESAAVIPALNGLRGMKCFWRFRPRNLEALRTQIVGSDSCAAHLATRIAHRVRAPRAARLSMASMVFYCPLRIGDTHLFVGVWFVCGVAVWCAHSGLATAVLRLGVEHVGESGCVFAICALLTALVRCLLRVAGPSLC